MSVVIRLKVPIEMHYTVIPMGTSKVNSSRGSLNDEPGANEPNILNDEPGNGEPFATVENEWLQLPVIYKRYILQISD